MKNLSRTDKEKLYQIKMTELQLKWSNPIDDDWDFSDWTDEQLNKALEDVVGQLKFEKSLSFIKKLFLSFIWIFIIFGIIGLLFFGIKQFL